MLLPNAHLWQCVCVCVWWVQAPCSEAYLIVQVVVACFVSIRDHMGSVRWAVSMRTSIGFLGLLHQRTTTWGLKQQTSVPSVWQPEVEPKVSLGPCFLGAPGEEFPCLSQTHSCWQPLACGCITPVSASVFTQPLPPDSMCLQLCIGTLVTIQGPP